MTQPMEPLSIASLFSALRDGEIQDMRWTDKDVQFRVYLPKLAALRGEEFGHFLCALGDVAELSLQPFRNESTEIKDLKQISKLHLKIEIAEVGTGQQVKVYCAHKASGTGARLSIRAQRFTVWDEAFDTLTAADLAILRGRVAGK